MAATQQSQAIQTINNLISLANSLISINDQMIVLDAFWNDNGIATVINNMATAALNADGSIGAADANPVPGHPLDPNKFPTISRSLSSTQITQLKTILDTIPTLVAGSAVTAQAGARGILNAARGG